MSAFPDRPLYRFLGGVKVGKTLSKFKLYIIFFIKCVKAMFGVKIQAECLFVKHFEHKKLNFNLQFGVKSILLNHF